LLQTKSPNRDERRKKEQGKKITARRNKRKKVNCKREKKHQGEIKKEKTTKKKEIKKTRKRR
jgi:hypothetical protein